MTTAWLFPGDFLKFHDAVNISVTPFWFCSVDAVKFTTATKRETEKSGFPYQKTIIANDSYSVNMTFGYEKNNRLQSKPLSLLGKWTWLNSLTFSLIWSTFSQIPWLFSDLNTWNSFSRFFREAVKPVKSCLMLIFTQYLSLWGTQWIHGCKCIRVCLYVYILYDIISSINDKTPQPKRETRYKMAHWQTYQSTHPPEAALRTTCRPTSS